MNKLLSNNVIGMLFVKALSMSINFLVVPLYLFYFESDKLEFGRWLIFFTLLSILIAFDFGLSSRLKNDLLSTKEGWGLNIAKAMVANLFVTLIVVFILLIIKHYNVLNFLSEIEDSNFNLTLLFIIALSPFKVSIPILQAKQRNWLSAFVLIIPQIFILLYLLIFKFVVVLPFGQDNILLYILLLTTFFSYFSCLFFVITKYKIKIYKCFFSALNVFDYTRSSFSFFITQICLIILITMNDVFYGFLGLEELVVDYQYYFRVYSLVFVSFSSITVPFWSAIRFQYVNKDFESVRKLIFYLYYLLIPMLFSLVIIGFFLQYVFDFWLGDGTKLVDSTSVFYFSILSISMCLMYVFTALLNSFDVIWFQAKVLLFASFIKFLIIFFSGYLNVYLKFDAVMLSTVISMVIVALLVASKAICFCKKLEV
ncbi:hypothetical protein ACED29_09435 [Shewanella sp. 5S214]|uniref:hypothetical protein n=1 Tax=Shewanella sp. 5S214 TaxID=3229999 RepID=UPI00352E7256